MSPTAENLSKDVLTIQHSLDGFSYFIIDNNRNTFVPKEVFQERDKEKYLDILGLTDKDSVICTDFINFADAYNVFAVSKNDYDILQNISKKPEIHHASSVLVASLIKDNMERTDDARVYLNIKDQSFEMIVLKGCDLLFTNHFRFKTKEDFLYFLLFSIEQLHLDAGSVPVYFLGMIEEDSAIVDITARYMRDIRFMGNDYNVLNKAKTCEL